MPGVLAGWIICGLALAGCASQSQVRDDVPLSPEGSLTATSEPVGLATATGEIHGTLELPAARVRVPVVLIIAGSGPTDRDGNSRALPGSNNSLRLLAEGLAQRGIASLRYDKRGIAESGPAGPKEEDLRFTHYVDDAGGWIRKLRSDVRFSTVAVLGHSEGSLIGMIAAQSERADAFVSIAGAGRRPDSIILEQLGSQLPPALLLETRAILAKISNGETVDSVPPMLAPLFRKSVQPYLISWFRFDPAEELAKLAMPVLIVQGTSDIQTTRTDAEALARANPRARLVLIEGMNHVLRESPPERAAQLQAYSDPALPVVSRLLEEVADFILGIPRTGVAIRYGGSADTWLGPDKVQHFFMSAFIESFAFGSYRHTGARRQPALAAAIATASAAGLAREFHDARKDGLFSVADLAWDALGILAATVMLNRTGR